MHLWRSGAERWFWCCIHIQLGTPTGTASLGLVGGSACLYPANSCWIAFRYFPSFPTKGDGFPSNWMVVLMARSATATVWERTFCFRFKMPPFLTCAAKAARRAICTGGWIPCRSDGMDGKYPPSQNVQAWKNRRRSLAVVSTTPFSTSWLAVRNKSEM